MENLKHLENTSQRGWDTFPHHTRSLVLINYCRSIIIFLGHLHVQHMLQNNPTKLQVKMKFRVKEKFLCLLTLIIHGSWIIRVRRQKKIENQTRLKYFILTCNIYMWAKLTAYFKIKNGWVCFKTVTRTTRVHPSLCSMKQLELFLLPLNKMLVYHMSTS